MKSFTLARPLAIAKMGKTLTLNKAPCGVAFNQTADRVRFITDAANTPFHRDKIP